MQNYFNEKAKYYLNSQKYQECRLVAAINAAIFLNELPISQESIEYERLVDLVKARHGAAISISKAHEYLRIIPHELNFLDLKTIKKYLDIDNPIEAVVWHKEPGLHSVLIVDYKKENNKIRVLNFEEITNNQWWVNWKTLKKYLYLQSNSPLGWVYIINPWYLRDLQIKNNQRILGESNAILKV